jgi:microcompartment protein CcmK/EutM
MILGKVTGTVVATVKHHSYDGRKLLSVCPLDENGKAAGKEFLAVDNAQAGTGDTVLVLTEGNGVRQILGREGGPHAILELIVGIVDEVELGGTGGMGGAA